MTAATIVAALACLAAEDEDPRWSPKPLRVGDLHRVEMAVDSSGVSFLRNPETNALEKFQEKLSRRVVYRQRLLPNADPKAPIPFRALCLFDTLESKRESGGKTLTNFALRDEVKLLALDPRTAVSRAWSPRGPLRWSEVQTVSHLVFAPALNGLLPEKPIRYGDQWRPTRATLEHLSTLMPLHEADVECKCLQVMEFRGEKLLQIAVKGTMSGEDPQMGHAFDRLDGGLYIRPADGAMHSLNLRAEREIDDKKTPVARWSIDFRLNLRPLTEVPPELADDAAKGGERTPTVRDLALIAPYPQAAAEILHPRTWQPDRADGTRFELHQPFRNERIALNFELDGKAPTVEEYAQRVEADFAKAKGLKLLGFADGGKPQKVERGEPGSKDYQYVGKFVQRVDHQGVERLHIHLTMQRGGRGVTALATCAPADYLACLEDVCFIVKGVTYTAASLKAAQPAAPAAGN